MIRATHRRSDLGVPKGAALAVLAGLLLCASSSAALGEQRSDRLVAADIRVTDKPGGGPFEILLRAEPVPEPAPKAVERRISAPWRGSLYLGRNVAWRVSLQAEGYWAAEVMVQPDADSLRMELLPTGSVTGTMPRLPGEPLPPAIEVRIESSTTASSSSKVRRTAFHCPVEEGQWTCEVPAGLLDVRLFVDGFVPHYLWDFELPPGQTADLGPLELARGASVAGWIAWPRSGDDAEVASIVLDREVSGWQGDPSERRRLDARSLQTHADDRGFFQITGIAPGGYVLTAEKPGLSSSRVFDLAIEEGRETFLEDPIVLEPPTDLELQIEPPRDPLGRAWTVTLSQPVPGSSVLETRETSAASLAGQWRRPILETGSYLLQVQDAKASTWAEQWIHVIPGMAPLFVEIPLVAIEGRITMGDEPLAADLTFGSTQGMKQIKLSAGQDGRFEGFLPHEGLWPVDVAFGSETFSQQALEPVEVRKRPGRRTAFVEVELPDTVLRGEVVADDQPVPGAKLAILRDGEERKRRDAILKADEEGRFVLRGLSPGTLLIHAYHRDGSTPWLRVELQEGLEHPPLRLELRKELELSGLVLSSAGGVPGAEVVAWPTVADGSFAMLERALTDFDGSFALRLPEGAITADLIVTAPGFASQMLRTPLSSKNPPIVTVYVEPGGGVLILDEPMGGSVKTSSASTLRYNGSQLPVEILIRVLLPKLKIRPLDGNLGFIDMAPGEYLLCDTGGCDSGFLTPHGEVALRNVARKTD